MDQALLKVVDIVAKWDRFGQFLFFLIVLSGLSTFALGLVRYAVILVRGWPPAENGVVLSRQRSRPADGSPD